MFARIAGSIVFLLLLATPPAVAESPQPADGRSVYADAAGGQLPVDCVGGVCRGSFLLLGKETPFESSNGTFTVTEDMFWCRHFEFTREVAGTISATQVTLSRPAAAKTVGSQTCTAEADALTYTLVSAPVPAPPDDGPAPAEPDNEVAASPSTQRDRGVVQATDLGRGTDAPSVLSALPTVGQIESTSVLIAVVVTIVLTILIAFPTALLNSAVEQGTARWSAWRDRRAGIERADDPDGRWWWALGGVGAAAVISLFVDPTAGFNGGTVRMLGSLLLALLIDVVLSWVAVIWLVRRTHRDARPTFEFKPVTLLLVVACVLVTRLTGVEPGLVFGLVAGVGFVALGAGWGEARVSLTQLSWSFLLGLVGWGSYTALGAQSSAAGVFASETMSGLAVAGFAAMPIALFPLRGLPGRVVFEADRRLWAGVYAIGLLGFLVVLMPMPSSWGEISSSLGQWVAIYLAYLAVAALAWFVLRERAQPPAAERAAASIAEE